MHVPSIETHGVSTFAVPSITTLSLTCNTLFSFFQLLYPLFTASLSNSVIKTQSFVFAASVGVWTWVFRLLSQSSSQRPLGDSRARRWYSVFVSATGLRRLASQGRRWTPKPICRGSVRIRHAAGPSGLQLVCFHGSGMQSRVRQCIAHERSSGVDLADDWIVSEAAERSVIRSALRQTDNSQEDVTAECTATIRSTNHKRPVPYIQVWSHGAVNV